MGIVLTDDTHFASARVFISHLQNNEPVLKGLRLFQSSLIGPIWIHVEGGYIWLSMLL